jgi:hypothetical protein
MRNAWFGAVLLLVLLGFVPLVLTIERRLLFEFLNSFLVAFGVGIVIGFSKAFWQTLRMPLRSLDGGDALIGGVTLSWFGSLLVFAVLWTWRELGQPSEIADHWLGAFGRWLIVIGGGLHLAAAGAVDGRMPPRSYLHVGAWTAVGLAMIGALIVFRLDR